VIHVYGFVDELAELPAIPGLDDAPLEHRQVEGVDVVLSRGTAPQTAEVSREAVLRHAQVVEELMATSAAVLPAQLGRAFHDEEELAAALRPQTAGVARGLDRVRGCVEFGLRVIPSEARAEQRASGGDYMRARLDELRRQDRLVATLHEPLARLARESTLDRTGGELRAAYLVERAHVAEFRAAASRVEASPDVTVVCTGPWPPYSFADAKGAV
jgi:hypothetical protein